MSPVVVPVSLSPVSKHLKHVPKHRAAPRPRRAPRVVRGAVVMGGLAVATTGMSVSGGVLNAGAVGDGAADLVDAVSARPARRRRRRLR